jgi:hypothetical protein
MNEKKLVGKQLYPKQDYLEIFVQNENSISGQRIFQQTCEMEIFLIQVPRILVRKLVW